jgi:hypothetical protein
VAQEIIPKPIIAIKINFFINSLLTKIGIVIGKQESMLMNFKEQRNI